MRITARHLFLFCGAAVIGTAAIVGYRVSQSWSTLGDTLAEAERATVGALSGARAGEQASAYPSSVAGGSSFGPGEFGDDSDAGPASIGNDQPDLSQAALELHRELRVALAQDPELLASLDELFEETDEEALRENLELMRQAFLEEVPDDLPDDQLLN